jgi:hypothetical protein
VTIGFPGLIPGSPCHRFVITSSAYDRPPEQTKTFGHAAVSGSERDKRLLTHTGADDVLFAHNPKVTGSNPVPATKVIPGQKPFPRIFGEGFSRLFDRFVINLSSRFEPEFSRARILVIAMKSE